MSAHVRHQLDTLQFLSKANKKARTAVLSKADKNLIRALSEVIFNVLEGTVKLSELEIRKLRRYHATLYTVAKKSTSVVAKRKLLSQKGGFLTTLLPQPLHYWFHCSNETCQKILGGARESRTTNV